MSEEIIEIKQVKAPPSDSSQASYPGSACVICLDTQLQDATILDCCQHFFCYDCISQWLLTNPSCPMCKTHLNKIKHNLSPLPTTLPVPYDSVSGDEQTVEDLLTRYEMGFLEEQGYTPLTIEKRCIEVAMDQMYRKSLHLQNLEYNGILTKQQMQEKRDAYEKNIRNLTTLKSLINTQAKRNVIYNSPEFRRLVYSANLAPRSRLSPRFPADATANGITANEPLFRKRLIPFILRELTAIIPRDVIDISTYLDLILKYLKALDRNTKNSILNKLLSAGIEHPLHFLNNVSHFLASGQRLDVYDENCEYRVRGTMSDIRSYFERDSDNDIEFLNETITIGADPRRPPLEQWADNMRTEYFRTIATNPPAPVSSSPQVITIDANDSDRDPIVINDSRPTRMDEDNTIVLSEDEGDQRDGDNSDNIFAHPDLLLPPRRSRRSILLDRLSAFRPRRPQSPLINDAPGTSTNASESDSDVEIVSQVSSSSRKRPRYDDVH